MTRKSNPKVARASSARKRQQGVLLAHDPLALGRRPSELSAADRNRILDAWILILEGVYAHLPLKRALYGVDPIRALEHLRRQSDALDDLQFHRRLTFLINQLRDAHTQYRGQPSMSDAVAVLPFLVEAWGPAEAPRYVVSKVSDRRLVDDRRFVAGVTLESWNGVPFDRAVDMHAERETGGRPDARRARALDSLTLRSLGYGPPPDEHWVIVGYRDRTQRLREVRLPWRVVYPDRAATAGRSRARRRRLGIDLSAEAVRRAKKLMFNASLWSADRAAGMAAAARATLAEKYQDFLSARPVRTPDGTFGYLRIWSFDVEDDREFMAAAIELMDPLPDRGLIIDLRDNPGGLIPAAERLLQLFTPRPVMPTKFALRSTPFATALARAARNRSELGPWADSLVAAGCTGEPYSLHLPLTSVAQCNDSNQRYDRPIVVVVNANTYSSGDLFTAGIVDNRIGTVVCIGAATGAGGANVWEYADLRDAAAAARRRLPPLPNGVDLMVAIRRAVRSGEADGVLIEDAGIGGQPYAMTERDIFAGNEDLIGACGKLLARQPWTRLSVAPDDRGLRITTVGLDRLDVYENGHPAGASIPLAHDGSLHVAIPHRVRTIEFRGYRDDELRQRRLFPRP